MTFSLSGDDLTIRPGSTVTQGLREGSITIDDEAVQLVSPDLASDPRVGEMSDVEAAATILGMGPAAFERAAGSLQEGLRHALSAATDSRMSPAQRLNALRHQVQTVGNLLPRRANAFVSYDLDRGVAWVRVQAMDSSHRPVTIGAGTDPDSPLLEVVDRQTVEPGTVGPWVDPTPLTDAERYEAATPLSAEQARWDIDSALLRDADEGTARDWVTWRASDAQGWWSVQDASALERWTRAQATLAGDDASVTVYETIPDGTGRLIDMRGHGMDCRVTTTRPGQVAVDDPAGTTTMTTAEMMDHVRATWPDTSSQVLEHASGRNQALDLESRAREQAEVSELTVYTTPSCMGCEMTRRQLDKAGVAYEAVDLSGRPDLVEQFRGEGLLQAPIIETPDGQRTAGFDPSRIKAIVAAATPQQAPTGAPGPSDSGGGGGRPAHSPQQRPHGRGRGLSQ